MFTAPPDIIGRSGWEARAPNGRLRRVMKADHVFLVHMPNVLCSSDDACKAVVGGIQDDHMDNEGSLASLGNQS